MSSNTIQVAAVAYSHQASLVFDFSGYNHSLPHMLRAVEQLSVGGSPTYAHPALNVAAEKLLGAASGFRNHLTVPLIIAILSDGDVCVPEADTGALSRALANPRFAHGNVRRIVFQIGDNPNANTAMLTQMASTPGTRTNLHVTHVHYASKQHERMVAPPPPLMHTSTPEAAVGCCCVCLQAICTGWDVGKPTWPSRQ